MKDYNLGERAQKHRQAASQIWLIREKYLSLVTDLRIEGKPLEETRKERDELLDELHAIYSAAPSTSSRAYKKAQNALKLDQEMTFTDEEIDALLPERLRGS